MFVLFDVDSTLVTFEWADRIAEQKWVWPQVHAITKATMEWAPKPWATYIEKTDMIAPTREEVDALGSKYMHHITPGFVKLIEKLQDRWHLVGLLTQGYYDALPGLASLLQIAKQFIRAVKIDFDQQGNYASVTPNQPLATPEGKREIIKHLKMTFPGEKIVFIWDSLLDRKTNDLVDRFIWCGINIVRPIVQELATDYVTTTRQLTKKLQL